MKAIIKCLTPRFIRQKWEYINKQVDQLNYRVINLERSLDAIILSPKYVSSNSVGFNGQLGRKAIFQASINAGSIEVIVETGTHIGNSAGYMAETTGLLVHTCDLNNRYHEIAKMRLAGISNVCFYLTDSRSFLKQLAATDLVKKNTFFYLDSHWYHDLPLCDEIDIIATHWRNYMILIDDFSVPYDRDYGFDDYGPNKAINYELIRNLLATYKIKIFFPTLQASQETGAKRGCALLASEGKMSLRLSGLSLLKSYTHGTR